MAEYKQSSEEIKRLKQYILDYEPGKTIRLQKDRPKSPPEQTRIALFGAPGVGKSSLINSFLFVTGDDWKNEAPESFQEYSAMTMRKNVYSISDHILISDNRGMKDFGGKYMKEVSAQLAGLRKDGAEIIWDRGFFQRLVLTLESAAKADEKFQVHCAVIVLSAKDAGFEPSVFKELVDTIIKMTGQPPIVVITHKNSVADPSALEALKVGLVRNKIEYFHLIENYTRKDHVFDANKHLELLEALKQCLVVADRVMCHVEEKGRCVIL